ncbi:MAG: nitrophenyl compound nitroreductase subunit ArsF family protein [bacterium]
MKNKIENKSVKFNKNIKIITNVILAAFMIASVTYAVVREIKAKKEALLVAQTPIVSEKTESVQANPLKPKVFVYYLHATGRCSNCIKIEKWTKETIDKYYIKEQKEGKLEFNVYNVDEGTYTHFKDDYKLVTKSVVLSLVKGGKEQKYEVLSGVWNNLNDANAFYAYVKEKTDGYLKEAN